MFNHLAVRIMFSIAEYLAEDPVLKKQIREIHTSYYVQYNGLSR